MAKKTNKKPGKATNLGLKKSGKNLNQSKITKIIVLIMVLAFVGPLIIGLLVWLL